MERRILERSKVSTTVYLTVPGANSIRCRAKNLSATGVFVETEAAWLPAGTAVDLVFAVEIGNTVKLHRRNAVVAHIAKRGAGLMLQGRSQSSGTAQRAC